MTMNRAHESETKLQNRAKKLPFWSVLTQSQQQLLLSNAALSFCETGTRCYDAAQTYNGLVAVCTGSLRAFLLSKDGREASLFRLRDGAVCALPLLPRGSSETEPCQNPGAKAVFLRVSGLPDL